MRTEQIRQLDEQGYLLFRGLLGQEEVRLFRSRLEGLWAQEGAMAGVENYYETGVRRLANLANKGMAFKQLYAHPKVLQCVEAIMGPDIRVSMVNARDVPPHTGVRMPYHTDTDDGRLPDEQGYNSATAIWMLDRFCVENGGTAFVQGSHHSNQLPGKMMADLRASHPNETVITGDPGDVLVFNGHCWHAGRPNMTDGHRLAVLVHYLRADIPRPGNRRQHLDARTIALLAPEDRRLLGIDDP